MATNDYCLTLEKLFSSNFMNMKRSLNLFLLLIILNFGLSAQILEPVKWNFSSNKISDLEYELIFKADIDLHWHLYSQDIPTSPPATGFNFNENLDYSLVGDVSEESTVIEDYDPNFEMVLKYFSNEAVFKQIVKLNSQSAKVTGFIEFMCCDDTKCIPPTEIDFSFTLGSTTNKNSTPTKILEPVNWNISSKRLNSESIELTFEAEIDKPALTNIIGSVVLEGQIGLKDTGNWPLIQLYDFTIGNFDVVYEQAGSNERVSLDYNSSDLDDFAGMTLDRNSVEEKLEKYQGNLHRSAVEMAKDWRTDKMLRRLEAMLIVADKENFLLLSGTGDVIEPDDEILAIGSGGMFALSAAKALVSHSNLSAREIVEEAMKITETICIYTNSHLTIEEL
jgi:ATP-dependent HslUV protease subunit HslV